MYTPQPQVRVRRLIMIDTGGFAPQYARPYIFTAEHNQRQALLEQLSPTREITPSQFGGALAGFFKPQANVDTGFQLNLPGGWNERRMRFIMEIEVMRGHEHILQYLTGYTNYVGVSLQSQQIDPQMRFYINSSFQFSYQTQLVGGVVHRVLVPSRLNNVLVNLDYTAAQLGSSTLARPEDVISYIGAAPLRRQLAGSNIAMDSATLTKTASISNVRNGNAASYAASVLEAQRQAYQTGDAYGQSHDQVAGRALDLVRESTQRMDPFLSLLINSSGMSMVGNDFSWQQLINIDPNVQRDEVTTMMVGGAAQPTNHTLAQAFVPMDPNSTTRWDAAGNLQQAATILRDSISSIMAETMHSSLAMTFTNAPSQITSGLRQVQMVGSNAPIYYALHGSTLFVPGVPAEGFMQQFAQRLVHEVLPSITYNNNIGFNISFSSEFVGETRMFITLESDYGEFLAPSFASSMTAPVIAGSQKRVIDLADGMYGLIADIGQMYGQYTPSNSMGLEDSAGMQINNAQQLYTL